MKSKFLIILICIYSSLFSQNTNCIPQVEPMPSPALLIPRLIWYNQTATTLNVQKVQNNINDWTAGGMINRPIADGESITFRSNSGIKAVGLALKKTEANMLWRQPHSVLYGFYINRWSGTAYPMESRGSADTRIDYESEGRPWNDNSVFKIKRVCNKVYYYMDDIQFPHVSTIVDTEDLYFDMNFRDVLGWVYDVTIYGACGTSDCANTSITPTFTQVSPICQGGTFTLPTTSNNGITGMWSPVVNNQTTTEYTFTPNSGQSASTTTMTVTVNNPTVPTFTQVSPICQGETFSLPTTSDNGITGTWSPAVNNQATTEYTFTPNSGQCANTVKMTITVNPNVILALSSGTVNQTVNMNNSISSIIYTFGNGATGATITGLPTGVNGTVNGVTVTISGTPAVDGNFNYTVSTTGGCGAASLQGTITVVTKDWKLAPNSYIFTGKDYNSTTGKYDGAEVDGLYIPVKKAYEMWRNGGEFMRDDSGNYTPIPSGSATAGLYWEDEVGLIKSVVLEGTGENAKIKVLINKVKEGNAVVSYRVNNVVYWTWHVWVTDDPTNGSTYHHGFEKDKDGNTVTNWKWMDRNLGATNANFVGNDWHKSAGLQYQWGRKDPFPSFSHKDLDIYGISGEVNLRATDPDFRAKFLRIRGNKYSAQLNTGTDTPNGNIRFSIQNPINIITTPVYVATKGQPLLNDGEDFLKQKDDDKWTAVSMTTWFSKNKYKVYNPPYRENIVAWDLWGDTRSGFYSDIDDSNTAIAEQSSRYALKSPYDPCPCNWRVPSKYFSGGRNSNTPMPNQNRYSPWGKHTGAMVDPEFLPNSLNTDYPGIKIYPQFGFDFSAVPNMNLGKLPINGNYEAYPNTTDATRNGTGWATPELAYQDSSADGGLFTSTFTTATEVIDGQRYPSFGAAGLLLYSDPLSYHNSLGWNSFRETDYGYPSTGVRCIYDPNSASTPQEFQTEYITSSPEVYSLETLKSWTKLPNSYIEYTNPALVTPNSNGNSIDTNKDNDRIIEIPLKKAYAMHKLYLSTDFSFPAESTKSSSVVWTNNTSLIQKMEIVDGSIETAVLKITLNQNQTGNAVVAFHTGSGTWSNGKHNDPVLWSWHIWAPKSVIETYSFETETVSNGGIKPANDQFVNPTKSGYGIPMKTTFMDRDLGAKEKLVNEHIYEPNGSIFSSSLAAPATGSFPTGNPTVLARLAQISESGGLHYQWGRKDPLPVFYNPGWSYYYYGTKPYATYNVYRQNNPANVTTGTIPYTVTMPESEYLSSYTEPFGTYSNNANVLPADSKTNKLKKVLKYSVSNPLKFLYQTDNTKLDWISDENGNMPERWGHATEKSSYDPCPAGWRIVDLQSLSLGLVLGNYVSKGNTPWFYNAQFNTAYGIDPGQIAAVVKYENYNPANYNYVGGTLYAYFAGRGTVAYGYTLNKPEYNIGLFPNSGIRGFTGSNTMDASVLPYAPGSGLKTFQYSGIWTAANHSTGNSLGMLFKQTVNSNGLYYLTPTFGFRPQAGMSCRCAKIEYDANGNEIGRYNPDVLPVTTMTKGPALLTLTTDQVEDMVKNKLIVFPNPVKNILNLDAKDDKDYYYQIYNMAGQLVKKGKFNNKQTNISELSSGTYLIRINNSESIVKIIKQ